MDLIAILVVLRRRWILTGLGALICTAAGLFATYHVSISPPQLQSRTTESGAATVEVLVDTPRPLLAAARTLGDDTIAQRAALLGSLLARDDVRVEIARDAGVRASELAVDTPYLSPPIATPLSRSAVEVATPRAPNLLIISPDHPQVPILSIAAEARDPAVAERLANSATAMLGSLAKGPYGTRPVRIEQLGPVDTDRIPSGPGVKVIIAAVVAFALWCAAVVLLDRMARRSRPQARRVVGVRPPAHPASAAGPYPRSRNGTAREHAGHAGR